MLATIIAVTVFSPTLTPLAERRRLDVAFAGVNVLAESVSPVGPLDPPIRKASKERFFKLCEYVGRCRAHVAEHGVTASVCFNVIQISRDVAQSYGEIVNTPAAMVVSHNWGLELSEAIDAVHRRSVPAGSEGQPSDQHQIGAQIEVFRQNAKRARACDLNSPHEP